MANYSSIKSEVNAYIKQNGRKEITGRILNGVLNSIIDSLGKYYQFLGVLNPADDPGNPDQNVSYIGESGIYPHVDNQEIPAGYIGVFKWDGEWKVQTIPVGKDYDQDIQDLAGEISTLSVDVIHVDGVNEDDLTIPVDGKLQFADRIYNHQMPDGKGYKILRQGESFSGQVTDEKTIYEIRYDFDLGGEAIEHESDCNVSIVLSYDGSTRFIDTTPIVVAENEGIVLDEDAILVNEEMNRAIFYTPGYLYDYPGTYYIARNTQGTASYKIVSIQDIPEDSVLYFNGGSLSNGIIRGKKGDIVAGDDVIFKGVGVVGEWNCPGNIGWWANGCVWDGLTITKIDDSDNIQMALDSSFLTMTAPAKTFYVSKSVALKNPKVLNLSGKGETSQLSRDFYHGNRDVTLFYTDQDIPILILKPISVGYANAIKGASVTINGGVFDVSLCDAFSSSAIMVTTDGGNINGLFLKTTICGVNEGNDQRYGTGVYIHPVDGSITDVHIDSTISFFNSGIVAESDNGTQNWMTDFYFNGYIADCVVAIDSYVSCILSGTIHSMRVSAQRDNNFCLVRLREGANYVSTRFWDVATNYGSGNYTQNIVVSLEGDASLFLSGAASYWGENNKYAHISGNVLNIDGYVSGDTFGSSNPYKSSLDYREDKYQNYLHLFNNYKGTIEVHHYNSGGTERASAILRNPMIMFGETFERYNKSYISLTDTFADGDYVDLILKPNIKVSICKLVIYLDNTTFGGVQLICRNSSSPGQNYESRVISASATQSNKVDSFVFAVPYTYEYDSFVIRFFGFVSQTLNIFQVKGFTYANKESGVLGLENGAFTSAIRLVPGLERASQFVNWNFILQRDIFYSNTETVLYNVRLTGNPALASYLVYGFTYGTPQSNMHTYHALYRFDFFGSNGGTPNILCKIERISGNVSLSPKVYKSNTKGNDFKISFNVNSADIENNGIFCLYVLNPDEMIFDCPNNKNNYTEQSVVTISHSGTDSEKPTLSAESAGFEFYATDLGKKILWNGTAWVNMDGTALA